MKSTAYCLALVVATAALCTLPRVGFADTGDTDTIGTAASIATVVTGTLSTQIQPLKSGDPVFQNETLTSDSSGIGQFEFRDGTKLALGPGSTLLLDNFVYSSDTSKSKIVINLSKGALRFITGNANHDAYQINTPTATIAVRGTAFDVYSNDDGELAVAMINGAIEGVSAWRHLPSSQRHRQVSDNDYERHFFASRQVGRKFPERHFVQHRPPVLGRSNTSRSGLTRQQRNYWQLRRRDRKRSRKSTPAARQGASLQVPEALPLAIRDA